MRLQKLETLQYVATPYASFIPVDEKQPIEWKEGSSFSFHFYLFGIFPFGIHTIHVLACSEELGISTREYNKHVPVWNHRILLETIDENTTRYTDEIEVGAGWKTFFRSPLGKSVLCAPSTKMAEASLDHAKLIDKLRPLKNNISLQKSHTNIRIL